MNRFGGGAGVVDALLSANVETLYLPQELAVRDGLLTEECSMVVAAPTASGKTLIAEMAALSLYFQSGGKCVYLVPLRALAGEKYEEFTRKYERTGIRVSMATGDFDRMEPWLGEADIIITTNEKMDSLVRRHAPWIPEIKTVIVDEVHLIGDPGRGATLEVVLTRLKSLNPSLRVIALSATIPNSGEIAQWLGARLVRSDWRPVPLKEGVYFNGKTAFNDGTLRWTPITKGGTDALDLALETIKEGGQALIFVNTRKSAESLAKKASDALRAIGETPDGGLSEEVLNASREPTRLCKKLSECVSFGSAFHHAGIEYRQRRLIEGAFRANRIKVLVSTTTLAMGLNLPSRRVIIRDWQRFDSGGAGMRPIAAMEIKQMSGRAGRPGFDSYGEAVILAKNSRDERYLFDRYVYGGPEKIRSRLADPSSLRTHILASIAGSFVRDRESMQEFLGKTFFASQSGTSSLMTISEGIVRFLEEEGMVLAEGAELKATRFGHRVSELYIDPATGVLLRDSLGLFKEKGAFPLLHMICRTPDMMRLSMKKKDFEELLDLYNVHSDSLLIEDDEKTPSEELLSELKAASLLMQWTLESPEDKIVGHFGIGPGDLRSMVDISEWLLYSAAEIAKVLGIKEPRKEISVLRTRLVYGIKEELLELVSLKGIGRVRARSLFNAGFRSHSDIREAEEAALAQVPSIGKAVASDIKKQV